MDRVHIFVSTGRFESFDELDSFVHKAYSPDGCGINSQFMEEVQLTNYEPMCIEISITDKGNVAALTDLLSGASYSGQWIDRIDANVTADAAICVFSPNELGQPGGTSLVYIGCFEYRV